MLKSRIQTVRQLSEGNSGQRGCAAQLLLRPGHTIFLPRFHLDDIILRSKTIHA